jgi:antitoxin component YwqK of YwqJK toxin-antitoxin module
MAKPTPSVSYYDNGGVRNKGFTLDGQMHGEWEFLRKDGSVMRTGAFDRGRQTGIWRTYDRGGKLVKETAF